MGRVGSRGSTDRFDGIRDQVSGSSCRRPGKVKFNV